MVKLDIQNIPNNEYLNLKQAAELYGYTQHHFGLICRQGKLRAERVGKKWFTTKEWIEKYLNEIEEQYLSGNNHYTQIQSLTEEPKEPIAEKPRIKIPLRFVFAPIVLVIILAVLYPAAQNIKTVSIDYEKISERTKENFFALLSDTHLEIPSLPEVKIKIDDFSIATVNRSLNLLNELASADTVGIAEMLINSVARVPDLIPKFDSTLFKERTKNNFLAFANDLEKWGSAVKNYVLDYGRSIRLALAPPPSPKTTDGQAEEKEKPDEGIVVFQEGSRRDLKDAFSDKVIIKPDEEGDSGVIQPIFKSAKGDEFLYVMVPVEEEKLEPEAP